MKAIYYFLFLALFSGGYATAQSLTKVWSTSDGITTPESVLYDAATDKIYVSNINGQPTNKDGNGFMSVLNTDGTINSLKWITGLNAPKGQAIWKGNLYVTDIDELIEINISQGKITQRYKVANAKFLNDACVDETGVVYFSDMNDNKIYALNNGKISVFPEDKLIDKPNGLWAEKGKLYIGTSQLLEADLTTKKVTVVIDQCGGIDGLEKKPDGNFVYSNWQGRIFVTKGGKSIKLLDTVDKKNSADIDFVPGKNMILVPTFFGNSIDAYKLNP